MPPCRLGWCVLFCGRVSCSPGWSWTLKITEADLELGSSYLCFPSVASPVCSGTPSVFNPVPCSCQANALQWSTAQLFRLLSASSVILIAFEGFLIFVYSLYYLRKWLRLASECNQGYPWAPDLTAQYPLGLLSLSVFKYESIRFYLFIYCLPSLLWRSLLAYHDLHSVNHVKQEESLVQHDLVAVLVQTSESDTRQFILGIFKYSTTWKKGS